MVTRNAFYFSLWMILFACNQDERCLVEIDYASHKISIVGDSEFVVDSVSIEKFGILYFSKSLINKNAGAKSISLVTTDSIYNTYVDSLAFIDCSEHDLALDIVVRKKGSAVKLASEVAFGRRTVKDFRTLRGLKYEHCSTQIDSILTDRAKF